MTQMKKEVSQHYAGPCKQFALHIHELMEEDDVDSYIKTKGRLEDGFVEYKPHHNCFISTDMLWGWFKRWYESDNIGKQTILNKNDFSKHMKKEFRYGRKVYDGKKIRGFFYDEPDTGPVNLDLEDDD